MKIPINNSTGFYVYEHIRPDNNNIFYVGKGIGNRAKSCSDRNQHWNRIVTKAGGFSVNMIVKNLDEEFAFLVEIERIDQLKKLGIKICNMTNGGEGVAGYKLTLEQRKKRSNLMKGNKRSLGKKLSIEAKIKISNSLVGNKYTLGRKATSETKKKMSNAKIGQKKSCVICPYCFKEGGLPAMHRWHFDFCKKRI